MNLINKLFLFTILLFSFSACSNFEMDDLYGSWSSKDIDFTFNEDKTMKVRLGSITDSGRYRPFGNTLELVGSNNKVITRLTIMSLKNDSLTIDIPNIESKVRVLTRIK